MAESWLPSPSRYSYGLVFGVSPSDPAVFTAMAVLVLAIAVVASYVPARRAGRVDPIEVLKAD